MAKRGIKLKHPFDKMKVGDTMIGEAHIVQCAINWAKRNNKQWMFTSQRASNFNKTKLVTLKRIK